MLDIFGNPLATRNISLFLLLLLFFAYLAQKKKFIGIVYFNYFKWKMCDKEHANLFGLKVMCIVF